MGMALTLSSVSGAADAVRSARDVRFGALVLYPGAMCDALLDAARGGARVDVTLQRNPYRGGAAERLANRRAAHTLRAAGATVTLRDRERQPFHVKAAVCDGVAYLCDRNWAADGRELVVADDDAAEVELVRSTLRDAAGGTCGALATRKADALRAEAELIRGARGVPVTVETESFGGGAISAALREHAAGGAPTTLIVSAREAAHDGRERALIAHLRAAGVDVRETGANEKLALCGEAAWIGSANATFAGGREADQIEWGAVTRDAALVGAVRAALSRDAGSAAAASATPPGTGPAARE
jgi:hypothetical protein